MCRFISTFICGTSFFGGATPELLWYLLQSAETTLKTKYKRTNFPRIGAGRPPIEFVAQKEHPDLKSYYYICDGSLMDFIQVTFTVKIYIFWLQSAYCMRALNITALVFRICRVSLANLHSQSYEVTGFWTVLIGIRSLYFEICRLESFWVSVWYSHTFFMFFILIFLLNFDFFNLIYIYLFIFSEFCCSESRVELLTPVFNDE